LRGIKLYIDRNQLPATEGDEIYLEDLVGCDAINAEGHKIGDIISVDNFGASDLIEIKPIDGSKNLLSSNHRALCSRHRHRTKNCGGRTRIIYSRDPPIYLWITGMHTCNISWCLGVLVVKIIMHFNILTLFPELFPGSSGAFDYWTRLITKYLELYGSEYPRFFD
jgi:hypothetical protein